MLANHLFDNPASDYVLELPSDLLKRDELLDDSRELKRSQLMSSTKKVMSKESEPKLKPIPVISLKLSPRINSRATL
jgi:hypothetical protein